VSLRTLCVLLPIVLCACAGTSSPTHYYTLSVEAARSDRPVAGIGKVALARVTIPELIDRTSMVVRVAPNQVEVSDFNRWGEPPRSAIARVLAGDLTRVLGREVSIGAQGDQRLAVDLHRFDAVRSRAVTVDASWTVSDKAGAREAHAEIEERVEGNDYAAIAAAYSRALARLAHEIGATLSR